MAIQKLNLGTAPNGVGGDTTRAAAEKINTNFTTSTHAASKEVGKVAGKIPLYEDVENMIATSGVTEAAVKKIAYGGLSLVAKNSSTDDCDNFEVGTKYIVYGSVKNMPEQPSGYFYFTVETSNNLVNGYQYFLQEATTVDRLKIKSWHRIRTNSGVWQAWERTVRTDEDIDFIANGGLNPVYKTLATDDCNKFERGTRFTIDTTTVLNSPEKPEGYSYRYIEIKTAISVTSGGYLTQEAKTLDSVKPLEWRRYKINSTGWSKWERLDLSKEEVEIIANGGVRPEIKNLVTDDCNFFKVGTKFNIDPLKVLNSPKKPDGFSYTAIMVETFSISSTSGGIAQKAFTINSSSPIEWRRYKVNTSNSWTEWKRLDLPKEEVEIIANSGISPPLKALVTDDCNTLEVGSRYTIDTSKVLNSPEKPEGYSYRYIEIKTTYNTAVGGYRIQEAKTLDSNKPLEWRRRMVNTSWYWSDWFVVGVSEEKATSIANGGISSVFKSTSIDDCNDFKEGTRYRVSASSVLNTPDKPTGYVYTSMEVITSKYGASSKYQQAFTIDSDKPLEWRRHNVNNGSWTSWALVGFLEKDLFYAANGGLPTVSKGSSTDDCNNFERGTKYVATTSVLNTPKIPTGYGGLWFSIQTSVDITNYDVLKQVATIVREDRPLSWTRYKLLGTWSSWVRLDKIGGLETYKTTTAEGANVVVDSTGNLMRSTSSERYKNILSPLALTDDTYKNAMSLEPIVYRSTAESDNPDYHYYSFSAEALGAYDKAFTLWRHTKEVEVITTDEEGNEHTSFETVALDEPQAEGLNLNALVAFSHAISVKQGRLIEDLQARIEALEAPTVPNVAEEVLEQATEPTAPSKGA